MISSPFAPTRRRFLQTSAALGATLAAPGAAQAKPSPFKASLAPGTYEITLQLAGYKPLRKSVVVEKDKPLEINETLEKQ